jgi:hypothetical protein
MKNSLRWIGLFVGLAAIVVGTFCLGFYRGYHHEQRTAYSADLFVNELIYDELKKGQSDQAYKLLDMRIYGASKFLRRMDEAPLHCFLYSYSHDYGGNTSEELKKADEIIIGDNLEKKYAPVALPGTPLPQSVLNSLNK